MSRDFSSTPPSGRIATEAERWLARHDRGLSAAEAEAFARWRVQSPAHAAEFERLAATWQSAELLRSNSGLRSLTERLETAAVRDAATRRRRRFHWGWSAGLAAAAAVAFAMIWPGPRSDGDAPTSTPQVAASVHIRPADTGRQILPDGSVIVLRGHSEVRPQFTATERRVQLVRGEAYFMVQKDVSRPFIVEAQGAGVRAVGTAFTVQASADSLDVLVTEGTVALHAVLTSDPVAAAVDAPLADAGHRARVSVSGGRALARSVTVTPASPAEIEQALSWQFAALTLQRATLAEAIAAFNTHAGTRFELADASLHARQISGTFTVNQAEAFVRLLEQAAEVRAERSADGRVRLHAASP